MLAERCGDAFVVTAEGGIRVTLTLADAEPSPEGRGGAVRFTGPLDRRLGQGTYPVRHEALGEAVLFIVPIAQDEHVRTYEAIFG